ncbi:substrate-binding domain-containing protein [Proteiniborus sp. MB09-C3]|uniref:substrate-binding domain-containing protein n=1 Tax=Proteiniborus sp. MB09-C3 TaxID=3050072 RepID=UPI00255346C9|nr:substrate-binding domain-containing protein [Proteiniborus sp. MB09-C3]WIV11362.1 substrate-binding domain-containing protein [Proteiniborus sp. MB09-C3]
MKKTISAMLLLVLASTLFIGCSKSEDGFNTSKDISVISREDGSGTRGAFIELFKIEEKDSDGKKIDKTTKEATIANKTDVMLTNVSGDLYAIGYVSMGSLNDSVKALDIDNAAANVENIKNGTYKISRPFNIAIKGEATGLKKDFIDFILSADGQSVVAKSYIQINDSALAYSGTKPSGKIVVAGSSSVTPIMEKLKEAYISVNPNANIEIQQSDSTTGIQAVIDGTCDIGMASRELKDSEKASLTPIEIALDGIAVIVNTDNPLDNISSDEVKSIFTGSFTSWNEVIKETK